MSVGGVITPTSGQFETHLCVVKSFTANTDGEIWNLGSRPRGNFSLQVYGMDANGRLTATAWNAVLQGSNNGYDWTPLLSHVTGTNVDGATVFTTESGPCLFVQLSMSELDLGSATSVVVVVMGK